MENKLTIELAGALILNENNELLLIHRNSPNRIQWELPGGKVEKDESIEQTAIRELKEELNIVIHIDKYLGCDISIEDEIELKYHWYLASIVSGKPELIEEKFDDIDYFSKEELLTKDDLSSNMKVLVKKINIDSL